MRRLHRRNTQRDGLVGRDGLSARHARLAGAVGFILLIAIAGGSIVHAAETEHVQLTVGRSTVLNTGSAIARVSLTSSDVADAVVTSSNEVLINGKAPGTISMFVWDRAGAITRYEVVVQRDLARLSEQLRDLFPGESIVAQSNGKSVVLSGKATSKDMVDKAVSVAAGYVEKKEDVVTLVQVQDTGTDQVLLRVRFAEVSRSALTELGATLFTGGQHNVIGRTTTQQFAAPSFEGSETGNKLVFSDFLNFFMWDFKHDIGAVVKALQSKGLFQSLAEPNLVAESGKEASFLAGGEFPVPIAQPSGSGGTTITVTFKEFGIRLNFTPIVHGDRVHLKVRPEVSTLDFANGVTLQGFRIPALSTRRTETELDLQNGQTFAIAGLINNITSKTMQKVPGIGDIPILGLLFRSEAAQKDRTELVVMITPQILPRGSSGVTPNVPRLQEPYLPSLDPKKTFDTPPPAFQGARGVAETAPAPVAVPMQPAPDRAVSAAVIGAPTAGTQPVTNGATASRPSTTPPAPVAHQLTGAERSALEQAKKADQKRLDAEKKQLEADRVRQDEANKQQQIESKRQAQAAQEQAVRDAQAATRQAAIDKAAAEGAAKRAAEQAKRQGEIDKEQQKAVSEAQAKLKSAQAAYQAEVAKTRKQ